MFAENRKQPEHIRKRGKKLKDYKPGSAIDFEIINSEHIDDVDNDPFRAINDEVDNNPFCAISNEVDNNPFCAISNEVENTIEMEVDEENEVDEVEVEVESDIDDDVLLDYNLLYMRII